MALEWFSLTCLLLFLSFVFAARFIPRASRESTNMNNVQRNFFKFLFILAVWSFLLIGLIKLNNDNIDLSSVSLVTSQSYLKKIPLHRNLLQKEKWNQNFIDQTSTTSAADRMMTFVDHEVLVDNRTGKISSQSSPLQCLLMLSPFQFTIKVSMMINSLETLKRNFRRFRSHIGRNIRRFKRKQTARMRSNVGSIQASLIFTSTTFIGKRCKHQTELFSSSARITMWERIQESAQQFAFLGWLTASIQPWRLSVNSGSTVRRNRSSSRLSSISTCGSANGETTSTVTSSLTSLLARFQSLSMLLCQLRFRSLKSNAIQRQTI